MDAFFRDLEPASARRKKINKECLGPALPVNLTLRKLLTELRLGFGPESVDGGKVARRKMSESDFWLLFLSCSIIAIFSRSVHSVYRGLRVHRWDGKICSKIIQSGA